MRNISLLVLFGACLAFGACRDREPRETASDSVGRTFDRVMQSGVIRVGYFVEPPFMIRDAQTQALSGIFFDITEELGRSLGLRIEWTEEASLTSLGAALGNRYDMIGFPLWRSAERAKSVAFSTPVFYTPVGAYVRDGDERFDGNLESANRASVRVAGIDGELAASIAASDLPKAKIQSLSQLTDYSQLLLEVATGKADITFFSKVQAERFMQQNPGRVREVPLDRPVRVFAECYVLPLREDSFREMINAALMELSDNGVVARAFQRGGEDPREFFFPAVPYRSSQPGR